MVEGGVAPVAPTAAPAGAGLLADLAAALAAQPVPVRLEVADALPSTNATLLDRARAGDTAPALLVAREQTAGRGRLGRPWQSKAGDSLTFSLALPLAPADWSGLSLAVGLALADALDAPAPGRIPRLGLKWPNDLVLRDAAEPAALGRKLGGILIETVAAPGGTRIAVIGVGLNLARPQGVDAAYGVAGLREIDPVASMASTLARVALPLVVAVQRFGREGFAPLQAAWRVRDVLAGRAVTTTLPGQPEGVACGVDAQGALRLAASAAPGAPVRLVNAGEISIRPAARGG